MPTFVPVPGEEEDDNPGTPAAVAAPAPMLPPAPVPVPAPAPAAVAPPPQFVPPPGPPAPAAELPLTSPVRPPVSHRKFGDPREMRRLIFDNSLAAAREFEPVKNDLFTLALHDVDYIDPDRISKKQRKRAILEGTSLARRMRGTWRLTDNATGNVVHEKRQVLGQIPYMTDGGTFVHNGNDYLTSHQFRLRPGVFAREKDNGELEGHVNVIPGKGKSHRIVMDPETGVFKMNIDQANIPIYPLLRAMGVPDSKLREAWGNEVAADNMAKGDLSAISKLYSKVVRRGKETEPSTQAAAVVDAFKNMRLDEEVTKRTLGAPLTDLGPETYLALTKKLLAIHRREAEPDDRDAPAYQTIVGPEDLFAERIRRAGQVVRKSLWKATGRKSLDRLPPRLFDDAIKSAITSSGLSAPGEEVNPAELLDAQTRITRMGVGGIGSLDAVTPDMRAVKPGYMGLIDSLRTPESGSVGVDLRLARGAMKGSDGKLYTTMTNMRTGKPEVRSAQDMADDVIAFPNEMESDSPVVAALVGGKVRTVKREDVTYKLPHMEESFSYLGNLVPMKSMLKGQRAVMASRMITQALPLVDGEAPLVQSGLPGSWDKSYEEELSPHMGAVRADKGGRVISADDDEIHVEYADGTKDTIELDNNLPYNRKTLSTQTATVKPGDTFEPGQLLARSNFTDAKGTMALGKNLRVAYLPFRGLNFEDAIVMTESAAKSLRSTHMYQNTLDIEDGTEHNRDKYAGMFPNKFPREKIEDFDERGIIKPGTRVSHGDPLVLAFAEKTGGGPALHGGKKSAFTDKSVKWEHHDDGIVTDVAVTKDGVNVVVKSESDMKVGDKLSGRMGDKGVISAIIKDEEAPHDASGNPFHILLNPLGIASRVNPNQIVEAALGKLAAHRGGPIKVPDFDDKQDLVKYAMDELAKDGLQDTEDIIDPATGRKIKSVFTGNRFFMKLHHMAESKEQSRGLGSYSADGTPLKGGSPGGKAKRVGMLELNALLSHGATGVINDIKQIRGQANPQFWANFMSGLDTPPPKIPETYRKFVNQLRASGINVLRQGDKQNLLAMRQQDVEEYAGDREVKSGETVDWKTMEPTKGGLFDPELTGGPGGDRWSFIKLEEPMLSPVMEEPARRLLGLTEKKFRDVLAGKEKLNGASGPTAVSQALKNIDVKKELARARAEIDSGKRSYRDDAVRRLRILKGADARGIHPGEWVTEKVPVLPPVFRPVSAMSGGAPLVDDANFLYKELLEANSVLKDMKSQLGEADLAEARSAVYDSFKAVTGLGDPLHPKLKEKGVNGLLRKIFSTSPKFGCFDDRAQVLTRYRGWVPFPRLAETWSGEEVATRNVATGLFEWQPITAMHDYEFDGELCVFDPNGPRRLVVTENHRHLVSHNGAWTFKTSLELEADNAVVIYPTAAQAVGQAPVLPRALTASTGGGASLLAFVAGWAYRELEITPDGECRLIDQRHWLDSTSEARPAAKLFAEELWRAYFSVADGGRTLILDQSTMQGAALSGVLLGLHASDWACVKEWSADMIQAFLAGVGFGPKGHDRRCVLPTRKGSLDLLSELACKAGFTLTSTDIPESPGLRLGRLVRDDVVAIPAQSERVPYVGHVYCVTVPNGNLYVRRDSTGAGHFSGNSVQRKLLGSTTDLVGRAVITPDPDLDMDSVGLPENSAWELYRPFVVRNLVRDGMPKLQALRAVADRSERARETLLKEMEARPVVMNRAPTLHRFGFLGARPRLTQGSTLRVSPLVVKGAAADFDGDTMQFHVPVSDDAVRDVYEKMLPSRTLLSPGDFKPAFRPTQEYQGGLYEASVQRDERKRVQTFATIADALRAHARGEYDLSQPVEILED